MTSKRMTMPKEIKKSYAVKMLADISWKVMKIYSSKNNANHSVNYERTLSDETIEKITEGFAVRKLRFTVYILGQ